MRSDTRQLVKDAVREIFGLDIAKFSGTTKLNTISEWDSFRNLMMIMKLQEELGVRFTTLELDTTQTIDDVFRLVEGKTKG